MKLKKQNMLELLVGIVIILLLSIPFRNVNSILLFALTYSFLYFIPGYLFFIGKEGYSVIERFTYANLLGLMLVGILYISSSYFFDTVGSFVFLSIPALIITVFIIYHLFIDAKERDTSKKHHLRHHESTTQNHSHKHHQAHTEHSTLIIKNEQSHSQEKINHTTHTTPHMKHNEGKHPEKEKELHHVKKD